MNNAHYFCRRCGKLRRSARLYILPKKPFPETWPRCCSVLMQQLEFKKAAAIVKLPPEKRLAWHAAGQHIYRGRRFEIWKAAVTPNEVAHAVDSYATYVRRIMGPAAKPKWTKPKKKRPKRG